MAVRDDFDEATKRLLAMRVGYRCSMPSCRAPTVGAAVADTKTASVGVAAHVTAAAEGGPRYDSALTRSERRSPGNGIWVCQTCSRLIDVDSDRHTQAQLHAWKAQAEARAAAELGRSVGDDYVLSVPEYVRSDPMLRLAIYRRLKRRNITGGTRVSKVVSDLGYYYAPAAIVATVQALGSEELLHWHTDPLEPGTRVYLGGNREIGQALRRWEEFEVSLVGTDRWPPPQRRRGAFPR